MMRHAPSKMEVRSGASPGITSAGAVLYEMEVWSTRDAYVVAPVHRSGSRNAELLQVQILHAVVAE